MTLTHKEISSLGGVALREKYPKTQRIEWAKKAAQAMWKMRPACDLCGKRRPCPYASGGYPICTPCAETSDIKLD